MHVHAEKFDWNDQLTEVPKGLLPTKLRGFCAGVFCFSGEVSKRKLDLSGF